jgi:4-hydroxybenzoate polyprenyltransferase
VTAGDPERDPGADGLPLCVDLDGTLVATDTLWESLLVCLRTRPAALLRLPLWLLAGRSRLKAELTRAAPPDVPGLPYREEVVAYLREARAAGRPVTLATAQDRSVADAVAAHLGLFSAVIASDAGRNLKGARKREALEAAYGERGYEYLGDAAADVAVWEGAARASWVGLPPALERQVAARVPVGRRFERARASLATWLRALRVHQWVKNVLVFVPLVMAHRLSEPALAGRAALAFACLCLCASSVYVVNDLMDLAADRRHPTKRRRPFAAGHLSIPAGLATAPLLAGAALALSLAFLPLLFTGTLVAYLALSSLYTFALKRLAIADVIFLAGLYSLRVLAGGFATGVEVSPWLIAFSLFFFLNLAFLKRYADLRLVARGNGRGSPGRDYALEDAPLLLSLGPAAGYMAIVVLALYIQSAKVVTLYSRPVLLWLLIPLLAYWISRVWLVAHRGGMSDDPIVFTTRDAPSWGVAALAAGVLALATVL